MLGEINLDTPGVFAPLLRPSRYKGIWGGRGSGKSHFFAERMIEDCMAEPGDNGGVGMRALCIREVQKDLKESSKALIEAKMRAFGVESGNGFRIYKDQIQTPGDGVIIFKGMQEYNDESIKSLEGFKRGWWEEAQTAMSSSISKLQPTFRATGSELWFSWNPRRRADAIDRLLRGQSLPTDAVVVRANWSDNPYFPPVLEQERQDCLRLTPDQYEHIWEGAYVTAIAGAYFSRHLAQAKAQGRIGVVGPDPLMTTRVFCDLGGTGARSDAFTMWVMQFVGLQIRVLNYYEAIGQPLATHIQWLREHGYQNASIWLPHDGKTMDRVHPVSFQSSFEEAGFTVEVVPNQGPAAAKMRIEAARRLFPSMWFNQETTQPGIDALGWYHEKVDETRQYGLGPEHDWSSHAADGFGLACVVYENPQVSQPPPPPSWRDRLARAAGPRGALGT